MELERDAPLAMEKSTTRNRIGLSLQLAASSSLRTVASTFEMVPKKRKPWSLTMRIWLPTSASHALCFGCRRTVECADEPLRIERMARRCDDMTTNETCRRRTGVSRERRRRWRGREEGEAMDAHRQGRARRRGRS